MGEAAHSGVVFGSLKFYFADGGISPLHDDN